MTAHLFNTLLVHGEGGVVHVTLNRPEVKNAANGALGMAMNAAMDELDATDELFVGVVTGAGGDFSAGADLKAAARGELRERPPRGGFGLFKRPPRKPRHGRDR
jgi:enoyl-CoA hydratase